MQSIDVQQLHELEHQALDALRRGAHDATLAAHGVELGKQPRSIGGRVSTITVKLERENFLGHDGRVRRPHD